MGVFGAALATGIGQSLSLISYIAVFLLAKIPVRLRLERRGEEKICRKLYYVGIPASLNLALPSFMITTQRHTCGICRSLCSDIGCLLQIADVYLFHHKRHCARYTPVD